MPDIEHIPQVRFEGFIDAWEQRKLASETTEIIAGGDVEKTILKEKGNFPVIANALTNDGVVGYYEYSFRVKAPAVTVTGRGDVGHAKARVVDFTPVVRLLSLKSRHDVFFMENAINNMRIVIESTGVPQLTVPQLSQYEIFYPQTILEEKKIGQFFRALDQLITLHQRKYDKLVNLKAAMLEKMFPKDGADVPEVRFHGFADAWEQRKLGDMMDITSVKRIHQSDWTSSGVRFMRARDIVAAFKNEPVSDMIFISEEKYREYSAISGKVELGDLLVTGVGTIGIPFLITSSTPIYFKDGNIIWFKNRDKINDFFLFYSFCSIPIQNFIFEAAGIGTVGTYTIESGKNTPISMPSKTKEQQKIGQFFRSLDSLITLHQRKLEKLRNMKQACLEKMFVS